MFGGNIMEKIDFVITWVDGSDPEWRRQKAAYLPPAAADDGEERYRDWELLRYWFRGAETFAPWVRRIYFITCGHIPAWLNTNHEKLSIVCHKDYIPEKFLPTFNSNALEMFFHKLPGLSEHFVYFNDDMFLICSLQPEHFFHDGKPRDMLAFQPVVANPKNPVMSHLFLNNSLILSKYFDKRRNVKQQPRNYFHIGYPPLYFFYNILELAFPLFTGFYTAHGPTPFLKSTYEKLWELEAPVLLQTASHRFRDKDDVTVYLFREWQKLTGNFYASNPLKYFRYFNLSDDNETLYHVIAKQKTKLLCINDSASLQNFEKVKTELILAFKHILPMSSSFETDIAGTN